MDAPTQKDLAFLGIYFSLDFVVVYKHTGYSVHMKA